MKIITESQYLQLHKCQPDFIETNPNDTALMLQEDQYCLLFQLEFPEGIVVGNYASKGNHERTKH